MASGSQSGPIAVYGASGYTGTLIAHELQRRGADFVIAGRSREKLQALSGELGGVRTATARVDDGAALRELLEPCAAVIACAGPFTLHGEPVVAAAADTGTNYVDTTGEQPFIKLVFDRYGERAGANGAALVPAMGFDYVPGDLIASLTAEGMGPLDEIVIAYSVRGFGATRGTLLSGLEMAGGGDLQWRDGDWRPAPRGANGGSFRFPAPIGERRMLRYPAGEQITVPRHVETANVRTLLRGMVGPERLAPLAALTLPAAGLAMRTPLRRAITAAIRRLPEGPSDEDRRSVLFTVVCDARAGDRTRRGLVRGGDVYGLTAVTASEGALRMADPAFDRKGALAPAQAFDPASFLDSLADNGIEREVEPLPETVSAPS